MAMIGRAKDGVLSFRYRCECRDCDADGRLSFPISERGPIACPEGCGAAYVPWRNPLNGGKWELKAVVMPVYGP